MNNSCQFVVAVHLMAVLRTKEEVVRQFGGDAKVTSDEIAESVNTNPVVIRRVLSQLQEAGLVITKTGRGGGAMLGRGADAITLYDIYEVVQDAELFRMHVNTPNQACPVGGNIQPVIGEVFEEAFGAMRKVLEGKTVEDLFTVIMERSGIPPMLEEGLSYEEISARLQGDPPAFVQP